MTESEKIQQIASHIHEIIRLLGEDPDREGLKKTPIRSAKALTYITSGYQEDAVETIKQAIFEHAGSKMVIVKDIEFYSMCEHHILPFYGKVSVGYIPDGEMVGLSKIARLVNIYARRLQVQERLTAQIAHKLSEAIKTKGVVVVCSAQHLCMKMRGVEKQDSSTTTVEYTGAFETDVNLKEEFFRCLYH